MKSFVYWLIATLFGFTLGYGLSWVTGLSIYLSLGIGVIIGSSVGVTFNIHRERDSKIYKQEIEEESNAELEDVETRAETSDETNQKDS